MPRAPTVDRRLDELLRREVAAATERALANEGRFDDDEWGHVTRLARLVEIREARAMKPRSRWPLLVVLGGAVVFVSLLFGCRVRSTDIELDLKASSVELLIGTPGSAPQPLCDSIVGLASLDINPVARLQVPSSSLSPDRIEAGDEDAAPVLVRTVDGARPGRIGVAGLVVPAGTRVGIEATDVAGRYRIALQAPAGQSFRIETAVEGRVAVRSRLTRRELDLEVPDRIMFESGGPVLDLVVSFARDVRLDVWPQLPLTGFRLEVVRRSGNLSHIHPVSPILSGTMFFEDLAGRQLALRPAEAMRFGGLAGELRLLRLEPGGIALNAHLHVRELSAGPSHQPRNLMPTWLEALQARPALYLWWGSALSLFTLVAAVLRWWGVKL